MIIFSCGYSTRGSRVTSPCAVCFNVYCIRNDGIQYVAEFWLQVSGSVYNISYTVDRIQDPVCTHTFEGAPQGLD